MKYEHYTYINLTNKKNSISQFLFFIFSGIDTWRWDTSWIHMSIFEGSCHPNQKIWTRVVEICASTFFESAQIFIEGVQHFEMLTIANTTSFRTQSFELNRNWNRYVRDFFREINFTKFFVKMISWINMLLFSK